MALTRKLLSALGIEADKIDEIITAHTETVDALKAQRDDLKSKADKYDSLKSDYDELRASKGQPDEYKSKYDELKKEFDNYKADRESRDALERKKSAYRELLKEAGIPDKRFNVILKVTDLMDMKLDKEGKFENEEDLTAKIKEDWGDFISVDRTQGANTPNPTTNSGSTGMMTKKEIMAIRDPEDRQKAIAENHELFNF